LAFLCLNALKKAIAITKKENLDKAKSELKEQIDAERLD
jgi:hypothetical protein